MSFSVFEGSFTTGSTTSPIDSSIDDDYEDNYFNGMTLIPLTGVVAFQPRLIVDFVDLGAGSGARFEVDPDHPFTTTTGTGVYVVVTNQGSLVTGADSTNNYTVMDAAGNKTDAVIPMTANTASLLNYAKAQVARGMGIIKGTVTSVSGTPTTEFSSTDLIGFGDNYFDIEFSLQLVQANAAANDGITREITTYASTGGTFTCPAFPGDVAVGDEIVILHKTQLLLVPAVAADMTAEVPDQSPFAWMLTNDGNTSDYDAADDSLEAIADKQGDTDQLTVPTDPAWDDANSWWEGNILALLQKALMYLGAGDGATNVEVTEDHSLPEYTKFTYTEADADRSEMIDDSYLAQIMAQDGDGSAFNDHTMSLEALQLGGAAFRGPIESGSSVTAHIIGALKGFGDNYFNDEWFLFCSYDVGDAGAAPQGEVRQITDYVSSSGTFTTTAFTAVAETGDLMIPVHRSNIGLLGVLHDITDIVDMSAYIPDHSVLANMLTSDGDTSGYDRQTDSQEAIADAVGAAATVIDTIDTNTELLYTVADGDLSEMTDDSYLAMIMAIDGNADANYDDNTMSLEALRAKLDAIQGGAETLESLDDELDAMLDLARTDSGTETMDGTELTLYEESDTTAFAWFYTWVDFSGANFGAGEDTTIRLYTKIKSGGNYREVWSNAHPYLEAALPTPIVVQVPNGDDGPDIAEFKNIYGVKMTGQQALIGAGWNDLDHESFDAKAGA